jgi:hypothetical protein
LAEDKDFLTMERKKKVKNSCIYEDEDDNDIKIWFKQLKKPPLHNYAKYTTELDITPTFAIGNMFEIPNYFKFKAFVEYLVEFILDHSSIIKKVCMVHLHDGWLFNHSRFKECFEHLHEVNGGYFFNNEIYGHLAKICRDIKIVNIVLAIKEAGNNTVAKLIKGCSNQF